MSGLASQGTQFEVDTTGSGNWVAIASVKDQAGPKRRIGSKQVTPLNPTNRSHDFIPTVGDGGDVTLSLLFNSAEWNTLLGYEFLTMNWKVVFTQGSTWAFKGFWTEFDQETGDVEADVEAKVTFKVTGKPVFTP
jgi:hypothetical protein